MVSDVGEKRRWMPAETHAKAATKALASACEFASTPLYFINKALIAPLNNNATIYSRDTRAFILFYIFNNVLIIAFNIKLLISKEYFRKRFFLRNGADIFFSAFLNLFKIKLKFVRF